MAGNYPSYPFTQPAQQSQQPQFQVQQLFPQPQGNVYMISNSLEVANVPMGAGISIALCMQEGLMYLKSMQNGNPMFITYRILPYDNSQKDNQQNQISDNSKQNIEIIVEEIKRSNERINVLEKEIQSIKKQSGGSNLNELI